MLAKRIIAGVIGAAVAIYAIYDGDWLYFGLMTLLALLGWQEFVNMAEKFKVDVTTRAGYAAIILLFGSAWFSYYKIFFLVAAVLFLWTLLRIVLRHNRIKPVDSAYSLYGFTYVTVGFLALLMLRHGHIGASLRGYFSTVLMDPAQFVVFLLVLSTWASDTFAFAVGKLCGKNKLCPAISPGKTAEGLIGGIVGTLITAVIFSIIFKFYILHGIIIGLLVAILAPLGDLVESVLKRACQIKDSGNIIPGHGGILDRFDSLLFAAPAVFMYLMLIGR
jgi:phosphatidate cytidylyltransferase